MTEWSITLYKMVPTDVTPNYETIKILKFSKQSNPGTTTSE